MDRERERETLILLLKLFLQPREKKTRYERKKARKDAGKGA